MYLGEGLVALVVTVLFGWLRSYCSSVSEAARTGNDLWGRGSPGGSAGQLSGLQQCCHALSCHTLLFHSPYHRAASYCPSSKFIGMLVSHVV